MAFTGETKGFINYIYERYSHLRIKDISLVFEGQITHQVMKALTGRPPQLRSRQLQS